MKLHSQVSVITNSSSEIFVLPTKETEEEALNKLRAFWEETEQEDFPFKGKKVDFDYEEVFYFHSSRFNQEEAICKQTNGFKKGDVLIGAGYNFDSIVTKEEEFYDFLDKHYPNWSTYRIG